MHAKRVRPSYHHEPFVMFGGERGTNRDAALLSVGLDVLCLLSDFVLYVERLAII
jgi:hypothetical protein